MKTIKKLLLAFLLVIVTIQPINAIETSQIINNSNSTIALSLNQTLRLTLKDRDILSYHIEVLDPEIVTVDKKSNHLSVVANKYGSTVLLFDKNDDYFELTIQVFDSIAFISQNNVLDVNESYQSEIALVPVDDFEKSNITYQSSNPSIATVDNKGLITGVKPGKTKVTATYLGYSVVQEITVEDKPDFEFLANQLILQVDNSQYVQYRLSIWTGNDKTVYFSTQNKNIASVDENGLVTGHTSGKTSLIAKVNGLSYQLPIEVLSSVEDIIFESNKIEIVKGQQHELKYQILPEAYATMPIIWQSSHPNVARVVGGNIMSYQVGSTTLTARIDDVVKELEVEVVVPLQGIQFNRPNLNLAQGQLFPLKVNKLPSDASTTLNLTYFSSDEHVVSVDGYGNVFAKNPGKATIFANANSFSTSINVTVDYSENEQGFIHVVGLVGDQNNITFDVRGIDDTSKVLLEIPIVSHYNEEGELEVNVILDEVLFSSNQFAASGMMLQTEYTDKKVVVNVLDATLSPIFIYDFSRFQSANQDIWVSSKYVESQFDNLQANIYQVSLPISLPNNSYLTLRLVNEEENSTLNLYSVGSSNLLKVAKANGVSVKDRKFVPLNQLEAGTYYLSATPIHSQLTIFVVTFVGLILFIVLIFIGKQKWLIWRRKNYLDEGTIYEETVNYKQQK